MNRDKKWFKKQHRNVWSDFYSNLEGMGKLRDRIEDLIDQLDEPEKLSQEWIEKHRYHDGDLDAYFIRAESLENLIVDEPEKPIIPQFVADWISKSKVWGHSLSDSMGHVPSYFDTTRNDKAMRWANKNQDIFARAWLDGYEIEKEPLYYAKIKGHELIDTEPILDDDTGKDVSEWNRNIYFIQQLNKKIVIDMKDSGLRGAKHFMTIKEWAELGINEANAEFEPVEKSDE